MSRSYKKNPIIKDKTKGMKQIANRKVRNYNGDLANGSSYKKIFQSYDISDYSFRTTYEDYLKYAESIENAVLNGGLGEYHLEDTSYGDWFKRYKRK